MENRLHVFSRMRSKEADVCIFFSRKFILSIRLGLCGIRFFHVGIFLGLLAFLRIFISFSSLGSVASGFIFLDVIIETTLGICVGRSSVTIQMVDTGVIGNVGPGIGSSGLLFSCALDSGSSAAS